MNTLTVILITVITLAIVSILITEFNPIIAAVFLLVEGFVLLLSMVVTDIRMSIGENNIR